MADDSDGEGGHAPVGSDSEEEWEDETGQGPGPRRRGVNSAPPHSDTPPFGCDGECTNIIMLRYVHFVDQFPLAYTRNNAQAIKKLDHSVRQGVGRWRVAWRDVVFM